MIAVLGEGGMPDFAPEARSGPTGFVAAGERGRTRAPARPLPPWLCALVILAITAALWALIFVGVRWLLAL